MQAPCVLSPLQHGVLHPPGGSRPVGALIGAFVGGFYGAETCLVVAAIGFLIQALIILASPVLRLARQPEIAQ